MARFHAAIAAHIQVPALVGGDHADVFALRFGAFAGTTGNRHFEFVRRAQPLVTVLQRNRQRGGILHAVTAPGRTDARLDGTQRLAVGVAGFKPGVDQFLPDSRQLLQPRAEQIDPLTAGNFGVQVVAFGHLTDSDQPLRGDLAAGNARHHRVSAVFLDIGQETVVGILQRYVFGFQYIIVPAGRQHRPGQRFTDFTAQPVTVAGDQLVKTADAVDADQVVQLLTRIGEMLADVFFYLDARLLQLVLHHLLEQRYTAAATGARFSAGFERRQIGAAVVHRRTDIRFADVVAGADLRAVRQRRHPQPFRRRAVQRGQNQAFRVRRQSHVVEFHLQQRAVIAAVAHQHRPQQPFAVRRHNDFFIDLIRFVVPLIAQAALGVTVGIADRGHIHP
ncbi:hypothetical protein HAT94_02203 [Dickeya solani]|nr:hypothetical protein [Dickeya solani]